MWSVSYSPNGKYIISSCHFIRIWSAESLKLLKKLYCHPDNAWIGCVSFSPDGKYIASGNHDNSVYIWEFETGCLLKQLYGHNN